MTERVTLITGASAGIGTELARVFASKGHRAGAGGAPRRSPDGAGWRNHRQPAARRRSSFACDLEQPDAGDRIAEALAAAGVEVEYVVNNAGFGVFGRAIQRDRAEQLDMIAVNIRALTDLSLRFSDPADPATAAASSMSARSPASCRAGNGGLLRLQGLCAVVHRGDARRNWRRMACA